MKNPQYILSPNDFDKTPLRCLKRREAHDEKTVVGNSDVRGGVLFRQRRSLSRQRRRFGYRCWRIGICEKNATKRSITEVVGIWQNFIAAGAKKNCIQNIYENCPRKSEKNCPNDLLPHSQFCITVVKHEVYDESVAEKLLWNAFHYCLQINH